MFNQCFAPLACLMDVEATQWHFSMGQMWGGWCQATNWGQPCAQEQGLGWVSECSIPHGMQSAPHAEPRMKKHPPAHPCPSASLPGGECHVPGGRCCISPLTAVTQHLQQLLAGLPVTKSNPAAAEATQSPAPTPDTSTGLSAKSVLSHRAAPRAPIAAHQHSQSLGLYFSSSLLSAREPQPDFPSAFEKHELAPQQRGGKEERRNRTGME